LSAAYNMLHDAQLAQLMSYPVCVATFELKFTKLVA
jgi:hypothetical protein